MAHVADAPLYEGRHPSSFRRGRFDSALVPLAAERDRWFLWLPVALGLGIVVYFQLPQEPPPLLSLLPLVGVAILGLVWRRGSVAQVSVGVLLAASAGFAVAKVRSDIVAAPVVDRPLSRVQLTGFVELVEPRPGGAQRLTIRPRALADLPTERLPARVRIRVPAADTSLAPGDFIRLVASLSPPAMPALPGGYDFARAAWFQGLGAVGFSTSGAEIAPAASAPPFDLRLRAAIERLRQAIGRRVTTALPGETGEIANALITGQRGGISEETNTAFRDSGLLHILSISGLHMVIMAGAVFFSVRLILAAIPAIALRYPIKKWSAAAASIAAFGYLMISGSEFATVRSWIMISIMFLAVLLDRPAIAMRNVALSALCILLLYPEGLFNVGFQMSFAAVASLVSAYELIRAREDSHAGSGIDRSTMGRLGLFFLGIVLSTLIASLSVAPFAAYHFHKSQQYAILANLMATPVCNLVVMPAALATLVAMPFGLEAAPLFLMGKGIGVMVWCAETVARIPGAVGRIPAIPTAAFVLMISGGLWLVVWRRRWRLLGLLPILAGLALSPFESRPDVLVGRDGAVVAIRQPDGRLAVHALRSGQFEVGRWLEHDGDARPPSGIIAPEIMLCDSEGCLGRVGGRVLAMPSSMAALRDDCRRADIVVARLKLAMPCGAMPKQGSAAGPPSAADPSPQSPMQDKRVVITALDVRRRGTYALYVLPADIRIVTVADTRGQRPWSGAPASVEAPAPVPQAGGGRPSDSAREASRRMGDGRAGSSRRTDGDAPGSNPPDIRDDDHR